MKSLVIGIVILAAAVFAMLPFGLGWGADVVVFLRGALPVVAALVAFVAVFIGIADMKDRAEARREMRKPDEAKAEGQD